MASSSAEQAMQTLTSQWYNAVVTGCHLDPSQFQLVQGNQALGNTSQAVWTVLDAVPPLSVASYWNPSQYNSFSSDYGAVIFNLNQPNSNAFQNAMGDYYSPWMAYLHKYSESGKDLPQGGIAKLFYNWAMVNMPPQQANACYTYYVQLANGIVPTACQMWINAGGADALKAYTTTLETIQSALSGAPSASVSMDSATASSDVSNTWAKGSVSGVYDFFSGGASASYAQMTSALAEAGVNVSAQFTHLTTVAGGPLAQGTLAAGPKTFNAWYSPAALNLAYSNNNNVVWQTTPPTWQGTFGPNGDMQRVCSGLVVVDGITMTMSSNVGFSDSQQTTFKAAANAGVWPFFSVSASGGWSNSTSFDDNGNVTVTSTSPTGNPQILGVLVTPIGQALGSA